MNSVAPIVVALSGGVDSATVAGLLVERGEHVVGITMRLYDAKGTQSAAGGRCCGPRDIEDARRVCDHLNIPFYVVDYEKAFTRHVVDDFVNEYVSGRTPNPCARCNEHIKFTPLLARARALGATRLATGHYARIEADGATYRLRRGIDASKDQSYFLFAMPKAALSSVLFPLGALMKAEVRAEAKRLGLPNAKKAESQEICFVPDGDYAGFVERAALSRNHSVPTSGTIRNEAGDVVGHHEGVHRFTLGQRRGLGAVGQGAPAYVVGLDVASSTLTVGPKSNAMRTEFNASDVQWLTPIPARVGVQVRHRQTPQIGAITRTLNGARVTLNAPILASPGQAAVFYDGDTVVGGGWIA